MTTDTCPSCGGLSWIREDMIVINSPMTGESHPIAISGEGPADWTCEMCGSRIARPGTEARVLDGIMDRVRHPGRATRVARTTPSDQGRRLRPRRSRSGAAAAGRR